MFDEPLFANLHLYPPYPISATLAQIDMVRDKSTKKAARPETKTWEKDEEELQLEQQLFGQRKKRKIGIKVDVDAIEETGLQDAQDEDVSLVLQFNVYDVSWTKADEVSFSCS